MNNVELISGFLNKSYDSGWISGKIEAGGSYDADAQTECIAQRDALQAMLESRVTALVAALKQVKMDIEFESLGLGDLKKQIDQALGKEE